MVVGSKPDQRKANSGGEVRSKRSARSCRQDAGEALLAVRCISSDRSMLRQGGVTRGDE